MVSGDGKNDISNIIYDERENEIWLVEMVKMTSQI